MLPARAVAVNGPAGEPMQYEKLLTVGVGYFALTVTVSITLSLSHPSAPTWLT